LFILFLGEMGARPLPRERVRKQLNLSGLLIAWPVRRAQRERKEQEVKELASREHVSANSKGLRDAPLGRKSVLSGKPRGLRGSDQAGGACADEEDMALDKCCKSDGRIKLSGGIYKSG